MRALATFSAKTSNLKPAGTIKAPTGLAGCWAKTVQPAPKAAAESATTNHRVDRFMVYLRTVV
jgi:hypothetical protein